MMGGVDPELQAMTTISTVLQELADTESQQRVLRWAADKFGVATAQNVRAKPNTVDEDVDAQPVNEFDDFVDLYDAVNPISNLEKVLTAAYWLQVVQDKASWQSQQLNNLLKDTGNGVDHITDALGSGQAKNPALIRQMAKSGKSRQARKTYKLTTAGVSLIASRANASAIPPSEIEDSKSV